MTAADYADLFGALKWMCVGGIAIVFVTFLWFILPCIKTPPRR